MKLKYFYNLTITRKTQTAVCHNFKIYIEPASQFLNPIVIPYQEPATKQNYLLKKQLLV